MAVFINNFTSISRGNLECVKADIQYSKGMLSCRDMSIDNLHIALDSYKDGYVEWTVDTHLGISIGDINIFSCASTSKDNIKLLRNLLKTRISADELRWLDLLCESYKQYAGKLLSVGVVDSFISYEGRNAWARIKPLVGFENPIPSEEFKSFISISKTGTMTRIDSVAYKRLLEIALKYNPGLDLSSVNRNIK